MARYRRNYVPGGTYFFTVVTYRRRAILTSESSRGHLRRVIEKVRREHPFDIVAFVLLPDHLHAAWSLPPGDSDSSTRWGLIKGDFTRDYLRAGGAEGERTDNHLAHRERAVWQHRFREHTVADEDDLKRCLDYIHWNPVKHELADRVCDYPWSSFHRWVARGEYDAAWGTVAVADIPGAEWDEAG